MGQHRALELAGIDARHARSRRRTHRARGRRLPRAARCTRARSALSTGCCRPATDDALAGLLLAQDHLSRSASPAGRTPSSARSFGQQDIAAGLPAGRADGAAQGAGRRRAVVGPRARRGADPRARRAARTRPSVRPVPAPRTREDHAGRRRRELHGRHARARTWTAAAATPTTPGSSFVDPEGLREYVTELDAAGFQVHFHALGDRAVREALDAARGGAGGQRRDRRPSPPGAPAGRPSRRRRRGSPQLDAAANMQALWAAHEPQMDELTIPFLGRGAGRPGSTRSRDCNEPARPGGRQRLVGQQRRPARCDPRGGQPTPAGASRRSEAVLPEQQSEPCHSDGGVHRRLRTDEPPR